MKKQPLESLDEIIEDADAIILITETDGQIHLSFSQNLSQMETLDLLSLVTSKFYEIAEEDSGNFE